MDLTIDGRTVIDALNELGKIFGTTENSEGCKVLPSQARLLLGNGRVDEDEIRQILEVMGLERWSAENIVFGIGTT